MSLGNSGGDASALHRLPYSVEPRRYELHLVPDLEGARFSGTVAIDARADSEVGEIVLHAQDLVISSAAVAGEEAGPQPAAVERQEREDRIVLRLGRKVGPGPLRIELAFDGELNDRLEGFYRSTFVDEDGETRTIATTQFEATDARRAFPCFDEPDRKAVFAISIDVPPEQAAFSNGPVVSEEKLPDGRTRVSFGETIPMSTYLVAFVVGPLVASAPVEVDGIPVRVVHVPGRESLTEFALEVAAHALRFFSDWFDISYPAEKLDLVAIPDFAFGAMENLGCVTFRETALLVDPAKASRLELEHVADVVSHEIAHMWFGDLVTMKWWNGIWLNEAFATLMELLCVDAFRPEWKRWVSFGLERDAAMGTDGLHSTRPVEYPVGPPEEAQGMFDVLTYQKGGSVLRMLERYLGPERFRDGIRRYLSAHRLGNTETSDLWDAIEAASGEPIRQIMDSWILQGGFPLLRVGAAGDGIELRQEPFEYGPATGPSSIGSRWRVPVLARGLPGGEHWRGLVDEAPVGLAAPAQGPVVVNAGGAGFYRVHYDGDLLERLAGRLTELETLEQFNLLSDTWAALVAGRARLTSYLRLAEGLGAVRDPDLWRQVVGSLRFLDHVADDATRPALAGYVRALVGPLFSELGWARRGDDDERTPTLRGLLLGALGTVGADPEVRRRCLDLHAADTAETQLLDPDLAAAVVEVVAAAGGRAEFEIFEARQQSPRTPQEEVRYLYALAGFEDEELAARAFEVATTQARTQNGPFLVHRLLANRVAGPQTWARVSTGWDELQGRFPANIFPRMLDSAKLLCRDPALAADVRAFLAGHPVSSGQRTVDQIAERLGVNAVLAARLQGELDAELTEGTARIPRR